MTAEAWQALSNIGAAGGIVGALWMVLKILDHFRGHRMRASGNGTDTRLAVALERIEGNQRVHAENQKEVVREQRQIAQTLAGVRETELKILMVVKENRRSLLAAGPIAADDEP